MLRKKGRSPVRDRAMNWKLHVRNCLHCAVQSSLASRHHSIRFPWLGRHLGTTTGLQSMLAMCCTSRVGGSGLLGLRPRAIGRACRVRRPRRTVASHCCGDLQSRSSKPSLSVWKVRVALYGSVQQGASNCTVLGGEALPSKHRGARRRGLSTEALRSASWCVRV